MKSARPAPRRKIPAPSAKTPTVLIESLSHDLRGLARVQGKAVFIDRALPGETVKFKYTATRSRFDEGLALEILEASPERCIPRCPHFDLCGGCALQHMRPEAQIEEKQKILLDQLARLGGLAVPEPLPPLTGEAFHYRRKARIGVRVTKGEVVIGFREKGSNNLAAIRECHILHPTIAEQIPRLRTLIAQCTARAHITHLEVAIGEDAAAIVVRHTRPLAAADLELWLAFARETGIHLYLQPGGADTVRREWPEGDPERLHYALADFDLKLAFHPLDFVQVNFAINRQMVARAVQLLDVQPGERVLDLFCGLGNFTLPLARRAREVVGVEGDAAMVQRGQENARANNIQNAHFFAADLSADINARPWAREGFDKVLIDPPRTGALEVVRTLARFKARKILYVSCNPATLARDAGELARLGYRLTHAGAMDMFPQTTHVESMALFEKCK